MRAANLAEDLRERASAAAFRSWPETKTTYFGIAENDKAIFGSSESDIQTARVIEETDALVFVGPHTAQDDVVLFSALKCIDACNFDVFVEVPLE
jgi:hypothetical protein